MELLFIPFVHKGDVGDSDEILGDGEVGALHRQVPADGGALHVGLEIVERTLLGLHGLRLRVVVVPA